MKIGFVGLGKLGMPVAVAMARHHDVMGTDTNTALMSKDPRPCREAGVDAGVDFNALLLGSLVRFGTLSQVVDHADVLFVAVQTPHGPEFEGITHLTNEREDFDYRYLINALKDINHYTITRSKACIVVVMSTVLPGTFHKYLLPVFHSNRYVSLCYNPSFIAMGTTMHDFLYPEFVLFGIRDGQEREVQTMREFYTTLTASQFFCTTVENAELIKVAYNTFIGMKIAFANTLMEICHKIPGCNVDAVTSALSLASRRLISPAYLSGGMGDGGGCLPPGELVMTEMGIRPIETVKVGDLVLTKDGSLRPVIKVWKREYAGLVHTVRCDGMPPMQLTEDHRVFVAEDSRPTYTTRHRNGSPWAKRVTVGSSVGGALGKEMELIAGDVVCGDHYSYFPVPKAHEVQVPDHATNEYCELAGWYLSEGSMDISHTGLGNIKTARISIHLNSKETGVAAHMKELFLSLSPPKESGRGAGAVASIHVDEEHHQCTVRYGSNELAAKLLGDFGKGAYDKTLPPWLLWGPLDRSILVMRGLWQGDGRAHRGGFNLSTVSPSIAYGVYFLLLRLGVASTLRQADRPNRRFRQYEVRVRNAKYLDRMSEITGMPNRHRMQEKRYDRFPLVGDRYFHRVAESDPQEYKGPVYNLWVEGNHSFVTPFGAVSNCHPRDNIALSWLARDLGLKHDLFNDIMLAREHQTGWLAELMIWHAWRMNLPLSILGYAFKADTNVTTGSPALLLKHILETKYGILVETNDPVVEGHEKNWDVVWEGMILSPAIYLIGAKHSVFQRCRFAEGSVVIDPWRYLTPGPGVFYIPLGIGKGGAGSEQEYDAKVAEFLNEHGPSVQR